jgi:hypothetical protein
MSQAGAVFFGLAAIVVLAFLWVLRYLRDQQLRAAQDGRMMKSLRVALLRENSANTGVGIVNKTPAIPGPRARSARPSHGVELSLVLFSPRH